MGPAPRFSGRPTALQTIDSETALGPPSAWRSRRPTAETTRTIGILGAGSYVPERRLRNADLEELVATTDDWILTRTGIRERHIAAPGQATSDLAIEAGRQALARAGLAASDLRLILVATATPDHMTPPTAALVQRGLQATGAAGFDLNAACCGFVHALSTGHRLVAGGGFDNALIVGADTLSAITDYRDRESCVLFGDGAGALVIGDRDAGGAILDHIAGMDGRGADLITVPAGGSRRPASQETLDAREHFLRIQGRKVFRFAVPRMCALVRKLAARNGLNLDEIDLVIPHQANLRIIEAAIDKLGLDPRRVVINIDRYGNTSNASIPLALDEAVRTGRLLPGMLVVLVAFGAGLTWGASLLRW